MKTMVRLLAFSAGLLIADPQFYARDRAGFEKLTSTLAELQRKIAAAEEQWLELEVLREELAGS